ncbi:PREDICTED: uncharacterized protein LOC108553260 [Eufriesea mexicana]|uniref:uncharacterized protein LOC108553260 n=1 Tax=Eufriesea mexicana TaxID=516756 RepID=UPI00083C5C97|nr:PREDICTED: uncharacterized protein LOC108553260 [Eufriesea mexicana]
MEYNSEVESFSQNSSCSSTTSNARYRKETISPEEQSLLQSVQEGILETNEENIAFTKEILLLLNELNLEPQSLSNDIKEGLQKIALILRYEKLNDLDTVTLDIVCEKKKIEEKKRQHEEKQLALLHDDLFRKCSNFSKKLNNLAEAVRDLETLVEDSQKDKNISLDCISLSTRLKEYQQTVEKLENDLTDMQIEDLYYKRILNKYHKYLEMSGELAELNQYLSQYRDLPPNLLQAKALVEVKQKEYETLKNVFLKKTNYLK